MLPFIPRKVAQSLRKPEAIASGPSADTAKPSLSSSFATSRSTLLRPEDVSRQTPIASYKGKEKGSDAPKPLSEDDYAILLCLAVSDYSLWADADLRKTIEFTEDGCTCMFRFSMIPHPQAADIPLMYLTRRLALEDRVEEHPPETMFVKAIRRHASDVFNVRMQMSAPSRSAWYGKSLSNKDNSGGYELCLKDWNETLQRAVNATRDGWEMRSIYVVRDIVRLVALF